MLRRLAPRYNVSACIARTARAGLIRPRIVTPSLHRGVRWYSEKEEESKQPKEEENKAAEREAEMEAESGEKSELDILQEKYELKDKEVAKYKDMYARSVADFRNLQETTKREIQKARDFALQKFIKDLIESVDNFDRALAVVPEAKRTDRENYKELADLYDGFKMMQTIFEKTLAKHGLEKVVPMGEKFDPNVHEATFEVPHPEKEPGTIFHVQQPGFSLNNRVLRAAKVGVVRGKDK